MKTQTKAIVAAIVVLALALGTVSGVTYSWFTDSESSGPITVTSGNLDLEVEYMTKDGAKDGIDDNDWNSIDNAKNLFTGPWEPGHTEVVALKIKNEGSLALKYTANMNIIDLSIGKNLEGGDINLSEHLEVSTLIQQTNQIGDIAVELAFSGENKVGYDSPSPLNEGGSLATDNELAPGVAHYLIIKVDMPETVGNEINYTTSGPNATGEIPDIALGIDILATQFNTEHDSFGNEYDKDAKYHVSLNRYDNIFSLAGDTTAVDECLLHAYDATEDYVVNGNGYTFTGVATSVDAFQWEGGTIPAMSTIFSSSDGSRVTVNDMTFTGTMSAIMAGHYQNATYNNYNTEFNNVNIVDAKVVSFSANVSPALCVYGTMVMNECTVKGTTLSPLDTDPMWPVYDMAVVNYSDTTLNDCVVETIYVWNQAKLTVADGSEVGEIVVRGNMNPPKYGITINAGATVGIIDLTAITNKAKVNITIEDGATVGKIVSNGVSYSSIAAWQKGNVVENVESLQKALDDAVDGDIIVLGADIEGGVTVTQNAGVKMTLDGAGKTFAGFITVDGKSATYTTAGLTIENVNFQAHSISEDACINLGKSGDNNTRYICNLTVKGCTFDVPGAVGIKSYTGGDKNLVITGCTATPVAHSLVQVAGVDGIIIEDCDIRSVRGLNFNQSNNIEVINCTIDVNKYALRFGASSGDTVCNEIYSIKGCTLKSDNVDGDAVIVLRGTAVGSTLTIEDTTIDGTSEIANGANATIIEL